MHWSYCSLALSHRYDINKNEYCQMSTAHYLNGPLNTDTDPPLVVHWMSKIFPLILHNAYIMFFVLSLRIVWIYEKRQTIVKYMLVFHIQSAASPRCQYQRVDQFYYQTSHILFWLHLFSPMCSEMYNKSSDLVNPIAGFANCTLALAVHKVGWKSSRSRSHWPRGIIYMATHGWGAG